MMAKVALSIGFDDYAIAQLRWYMDEYRADTFAVNAPTGVVLQLTGKPAQPLDDTIRRYAAAGDQRRNLASRARTFGSLMAVMMRRAPTEKAYRARYAEESVPGEQSALDSLLWREGHAGSRDGLPA